VAKAELGSGLLTGARLVVELEAVHYKLRFQARHIKAEATMSVDKFVSVIEKTNRI